MIEEGGRGSRPKAESADKTRPMSGDLINQRRKIQEIRLKQKANKHKKCAKTVT